MSWKDAVNSVVYRTTGHLLTRETPAQRRQGIRAASRKATARTRREMAEHHRREIERLEEQAAERRAQRQAAAKARRAAETEERRAAAEAQERARMLARFDEELCATVERVLPRTMTSQVKIAALVEATRYVVRHRVPGAVVECGVWRGGSMQAVAWTLLALGDTERELHLFDTFEGMPPPTEADTRTTEEGPLSAEKLLAESDKDSRMWAIAGLDLVKRAMAETEYPDDKVHFHPGLVEDTTPDQAPDTIAILRLDTDWYASTKHELDHLYGRLSPGGILILDDYGDWDGARKATDEWLAETAEPIFLAPMGSGCIAVKPHPHTQP
jgi:hypothetical protein